MKKSELLALLTNNIYSLINGMQKNIETFYMPPGVLCIQSYTSMYITLVGSKDVSKEGHNFEHK
jgi:hypothetical protein